MIAALKSWRGGLGFHVVLVDTLPPETISSEEFEAAINPACKDLSGSVIILDADADDL